MVTPRMSESIWSWLYIITANKWIIENSVKMLNNSALLLDFKDVIVISPPLIFSMFPQTNSKSRLRWLYPVHINKPWWLQHLPSKDTKTGLKQTLKFRKKIIPDYRKSQNEQIHYSGFFYWRRPLSTQLVNTGGP